MYKSKKEGRIGNRYTQAPHLTQDINGKVATSQLDITNESHKFSPFPAGKVLLYGQKTQFFGACGHWKIRKGAKIGNRYNQAPHLTQDINGKMTNSHLDTTNESQEVSPFPAGDHKAHKQARTKAQQTQDKKNIKDQQKKYRLGTVSGIFYWRA